MKKFEGSIFARGVLPTVFLIPVFATLLALQLRQSEESLINRQVIRALLSENNPSGKSSTLPRDFQDALIAVRENPANPDLRQALLNRVEKSWGISGRGREAFSLFTVLLGLGTVFLAIYLHEIYIRRRILRLRNFSGELARGYGNLTRQLPLLARDELGDVLDSFNTFTTRLKESLRVLFQGIRESIVHGSHISRYFESLAARSKQADFNFRMNLHDLNSISESLKEQASAMNSMTEGVSNVASAIGELGRITKEMGHRAELGRKDLDSVQDIIRHMDSDMKEGAVNAGKLEEKASRIEGIVNLISAISDQINLLSLNAAIEAARAGDSGRGFAVVADEVGKLAEQSKHAVVEITDSLKEILIEIRNNRQDVEQFSGRLSEINQSTGGVTERIGSILLGLEQIASYLDSILGNTTELESTIHEINESASRQAEHGESLLSTLTEEKERIKERDREMKDLTENIRSYIEDTVRMVEHLKFFNITDPALFAEEVDRAVQAHATWMENLRLSARGEARDLEHDHRKCRFGVFYQSIHPPESCEDRWEAIGDLHRKIHESADRVLVQSGNEPEQENLLKEAQETSEQLIRELKHCTDSFHNSL